MRLVRETANGESKAINWIVGYINNLFTTVGSNIQEEMLQLYVVPV
jgi:hypothetical protein